jgi:hypothetical protein
VHPLLLKVGATGLTLLTAAAAAVHVGGHLKSTSAPLHPPVLGPAEAAPGTGRLTLTPSVRGSDVQPVTSTAAS